MACYRCQLYYSAQHFTELHYINIALHDALAARCIETRPGHRGVNAALVNILGRPSWSTDGQPSWARRELLAQQGHSAQPTACDGMLAVTVPRLAAVTAGCNPFTSHRCQVKSMLCFQL
jgi:hypothetical protein